MRIIVGAPPIDASRQQPCLDIREAPGRRIAEQLDVVG